MRILVIAGAVAVLIVALIVGGETLRETAASRAQLAREQRGREDRERKADRSAAEEDQVLTIVGKVVDPLGIFS